ncbi:MAG: 50S ribosomal protein L21e [archaeon]
MARLRKHVRENGKVRLSGYFKKFDDGSRVGVVMDCGVRASFPRRLRGMSGEVAGSRGNFKLIKIKDGNKLKTFVIHPVHLRKL